MPEPTPLSADHCDSRIGWSRWLQSPILITLFFGAIGTLMLHVLQRDLDTGASPRGSIAGTVISFALALYGLHYQVRQFPRVRIDGYGLTLRRLYGTEKCSWDEVAGIYLQRSHPMRVLWANTPMPATVIVLRDARQLVLWADHYRNMPQLRRVLHSVRETLAVESSPQYPLPLTDVPAAPRQRTMRLYERQVFKGPWLWTFNGVFAMLLLAAATWMWAVALQAGQGKAILFVPLMWLVLVPLLLWQFHYFEVTGDTLVVRHHLLPGYRRRYPLTDLLAAAEEQPYRRSIGLRVTDRWFHAPWYGAGSLRTKHWTALRELLQEAQIEKEA